MAVIDIAPSPQQALQKAGALSASRRFDSAPPLSGVVLPSLMEEAMLEAELAFAAYDGVEDFTTAVRRAAESAGGAFLFELPASSLLPGSRRIAVIALPSGEEFIPAFACMDPDGSSIRIEPPTERTEAIRQFAQSFIGLIGRLHQAPLLARAG